MAVREDRIDKVVRPYPIHMAYVVVFAELALGLGLTLGFLTRLAAFAAIVLNLMYFVLMISDWAEQGQNLMMILAEWWCRDPRLERVVDRPPAAHLRGLTGRGGHRWVRDVFVEDVTAGDEAPVRTHVLTRTDLVAYAGASGDFNPMHHDEVMATAAGQPSVFGHGMFSMGLLGSAITDYVGVGNVRRFQARFAKQTWPDEVLRTKIVVTGKRKDGNEALVDLDVRLLNAEGEEKVVGQATTRLASRG